MRWLKNMSHSKCLLFDVSMTALIGCALSSDSGGDIGTNIHQGGDNGTSNQLGGDIGTNNQQGSEIGTNNQQGGDIGTNNQQGSESSTSKPRDCQIFPSKLSGHQIVGELNGVLSGCILKDNPQMKWASNVKGIEARRIFSRTLCESLPNFNQCITEESLKWQRCFTSDDRRKVFDIYFGVVQSLFRRGCAEDGESLAVIVDGMDRHSADINERNLFVRECMLHGTSRWKVLLDSESDVATKVLLTHREMQLFHDCLVDNILDDDAFVAVAGELLKDINATMKCIHPENGTLVLCKTIEEGLIDRTGVCPVRSSSEDTIPTSLKLDSIAEHCLYERDRYTPKLADATSIDDYRIYFNVYCQLQEMAKGCLYETTLVASMCLNSTQYNTYKLLRDNLISAFDSGCSDEGRRLANLFYSAKNATHKNDAMSSCREDVTAARPNYEDGPSRVYQYYQELPVLRNCVFERVNGSREFVDDLDSLNNQLMTKMKCFNPQDGGIVLCETVTSN